MIPKKRKVENLTTSDVKAALAAPSPVNQKSVTGPRRDLSTKPLFGATSASGAVSASAAAPESSSSSSSSSSSAASAVSAPKQESKKMVSAAQIGLLLDLHKPVKASITESNTTTLMQNVFMPLLNQLAKLSPPAASTMHDSTWLREMASANYTDEKWKSKLVLHTSQYEDMLLFEGGVPRPSPIKPQLIINSPPCFNGLRCVGHSERLPGLLNPAAKSPTEAQRMVGSGFTLMVHMTELELKEHYERGHVPTNASERVCLLCKRNIITSLVLAFTLYPDVQVPRHAPICNWVNEKNKINGYRAEFMICPSETGWNGLAAPVAKLDLSGLHAVYDKQHQCRRVLQDRMKYTAINDSDKVDALNTPYPVKFFQS